MRLPRANLIYLFSVVFITLFCYLGHWQLTRYHSKKKLVEAATASINGPAVMLTGQEKMMPPEFSRVALQGHYDNALTLLVENKTYHGQLGYEVLTAFHLQTPLPANETNALPLKMIWVDRGWIAAPTLMSQQSASAIPVIPVAVATQAVGHTRQVGGYQFMLGANISNSTARPLIVQKIDLAELSTVFHKEFYPFILRLDKTAPDGFVRDWVVSTMPPAQHLGYAIQWFLMAFVLFLMSLYFYFKRRR